MSESEDGGPGRREVAHRLFAAEFDDAEFSYSESDEERAPNYVVTPTGARVNRLFVVGVLTELEQVNEEVLRARIVDPTGPFVVYAGQYQPEALAFLEAAEPPMFVAVTGKARTFEPEDSDRVFTSIRPESISEVDAETRDRWVVQAVEQTVDRVGRTASAKQSGLSGDALTQALVAAGVSESDAAGTALALDYYGTTGEYLQAVRALALDCARVVAGDRDEAGQLSLAPDDGTDAPLSALATMDIEAAKAAADTEAMGDADATAETAEASGEPSGASSPDADATETGESTGTADSPESRETAAAPESTETTASPESTESAPESTGSTASTESTESTTSTESTETTDSTDAESTDSEDTTTEGDAESTEPVSEEVPSTAGASEGAESTDDAEPEASSASDTADSSETLGDFEDSGETAADEDVGDFDAEFELDEDEREEIEQEYGTDFQSGTEVDDAGEADIDTPDPEELAEMEAEAADERGGAATATESDAAAEPADAEADESDAGSGAADDSETDSPTSGESTAAEPVEDVDIEDAVMDAMTDLDDGSGADREAVVAAVTDEYGADRDAVEDAIQDALMGGRCYEPDDGKLTPI